MSGTHIVLHSPDAKFLRLPMDDIYNAEARIKEVAFVNAHKAPELLACFNEAFLTLIEHLVKIKLTLLEAWKVANTRRSIVLLDIVPTVLKEKGIASARSPGGSEDQRQAVLDQDAEWLKAMDYVHLVEATQELLEGKKKALEMAYTSVKKILGDSYSSVGQKRFGADGSNLAGLTPGQVVPR